MPNASNPPGDYGEPIYFDAHGGKNHVILYRSRTNPDLACEFFFRSKSKDNRSYYYRCTKCWYLYKRFRGTCATMIVRDNRIITDPENPQVPHQCEFRPLENVARNRASIARRRRRVNALENGSLNLDSNIVVDTRDPLQALLESTGGRRTMDEERNENGRDGENGATTPSSSDSSRTNRGNALEDNPLWARIRERLSSNPGSIDLACDESLGMYSPAGSPDMRDAGSVDETYASTSSINYSAVMQTSDSSNKYLDEAFAASMFKKNDEALGKLNEAVESKENFDIDDISLVDNVFSCKFNSAKEISTKIQICEEWLCFLVKIVPLATARWLSHYQFSLYYPFHMLHLIFRNHNDQAEKKRFFEMSQPLFKSLLHATALIPDSLEEVNNTKLDILLSLSLIAVQYYDVCGDEAVKLFEHEINEINRVTPNYSTETSLLMVQKVVRISNNLDERKRLLTGSVVYS